MVSCNNHDFDSKDDDDDCDYDDHLDDHRHHDCRYNFNLDRKVANHPMREEDMR